MIPYDDLVAALSAWRARQGLPVSTMGGAAPAPAPVPQAAAAIPDSGPRSAPPKAPPPAAPRTKQPSVPPPLAHPDAEEVDAAMLDEAHYENEGDDFALAFGKQPAEDGAEGSTAIGGAPQRDTVPGKRGRDDEEW